jgi:hypothetical protein
MNDHPCPATAPLDTASPEFTVFDVAQVRLQTYWTAGGDGLVLMRVEDEAGRALISASLFGRGSAGAARLPPDIATSTFDERAAATGAQLLPLAEAGGLVRYLIVADDETTVRASSEAFRSAWGFAYDPIVRPPRRRGDGKWVAEASRAASAD